MASRDPGQSAGAFRGRSLSSHALRLPRLNAIVDADIAERNGWRVPDLAAACWDGGARFIQVRAKHKSSGELLALVDRTIETLCARGGSITTSLASPSDWDRDTLLIVNDRADVARMAGASGVHVGQDDLAPSDVRRVLGTTGIVGLSTHTLDQIAAGSAEPVDYLAIGPVFGTLTKATGYQPVGLARVADASAAGRPVVAIGGITLETCAAVIRAGAAAVAVISDLLAGGDPAQRTRAFIDRLGRV